MAFKLPKIPKAPTAPAYPKEPGYGYRRPGEGNDTNLDHFEPRIRPLPDLGSGIHPAGSQRPMPYWTQFLAPKDYSWVYSEETTAITAAATVQQVDSIQVPGTLALIILEWTPLLLRPKSGQPQLYEFPAPEEYSQLMVASLSIGGRSVVGSSISLGGNNISGTRFVNRRAFQDDNSTFPLTVYGSAGEGAIVNFTWSAAPNSGTIPSGTDLLVGSILLGMQVPISIMDKIIDWTRVL